MFKPIGDRVVLRVDITEEKTRSGLFLPAGASDESFVVAEVVAASDGFYGDGGWIDLQVVAGDKVVIGKETGIAVKIDGQHYRVAHQHEIFGKAVD